ncbi:MAG TPA: permease prefix domain 1-containing protein [Acidimicrobiia bacterium]|nr:permease prefix domain 1-containing protein [Acidimicrobiia bacterium]
MSELTERYVNATLRTIPDKQRADIEAELRGSIEDAIDAQTAGGEDASTAEKKVLTELGDPDRLAAAYLGRPDYLIGPELFYTYKRMLAVLLVTVLPVVVAVIAVVQIIAGDDIGSVVGQVVGIVISVVVHIVFWTTLVFAILERTDEKPPTEGWTLSLLPPVTATGGVKVGETIATVVVLVMVITAMALSRTLSPFTTAGGEAVPIFDPSMWDFWFPYFIVVLALEIVFELVKYRIGRWTWGLGAVNLALNAAFAVPAIYLLVTEQIFNPVFFQQLGFEVDVSAGGPTVIISVAVIAAVAIWDTVDGFRKARRAR